MSTSNDDMNKLKSARGNVDWEIEIERHRLICRLIFVMRVWKDRLPNLLEIFRPEEIERLLMDSIDLIEEDPLHEVGEDFIEFVARSGYKNEPDLDENGKPELRRSTPVHLAARRNYVWIIHHLFDIYGTWNYIDESGFTHFRAACATLRLNVDLIRFFELRQDLNCPGFVTDRLPLHWALEQSDCDLVALFLRNGADPNLADERGSTPLHVICKRKEPHNYDLDSLVRMLYVLGHAKYQPVRVDAHDEAGRTPLHYAAMANGLKRVTAALLSYGADPNLADADGFTPLHIIAKKTRIDDNDLMEVVFKSSEDMQQTVQVDARDKSGWTPLQWAVASYSPTVDVLLNHGADLSDFVFPSASLFDERLKSTQYGSMDISNLNLASGAMFVFERLELSGYELDRSDALTIATFFAKSGLFEKSMDLQKRWRDSEDFASAAKDIMIMPQVSLYDFTRSRLDEAKKLIACKEFVFVCFSSSNASQSIPEESRRACLAYLCEIVTRRFFLRWAVKYFLELTNYRLPILCCEKVTELLMNEDLCRISLAALQCS